MYIKTYHALITVISIKPVEPGATVIHTDQMFRTNRVNNLWLWNQTHNSKTDCTTFQCSTN